MAPSSRWCARHRLSRARMQPATEKGGGKREEGRVLPDHDAPATTTAPESGRTLPSSPFPLPVFQRVLRTIRTVMGMPNYEGYLEHCTLRHPGEPVMSRAEYYSYHVSRRY